jgi:hypothetical protein
MKKIKILLIVFLAIAGAVVIYKISYKNNIIKNVDNIKVSNEYDLLDNNNIYIYKSADEIANILNNGTGVIFFCIKENKWCQYYAKYLNNVSVANGINKIYYLNIKQDRNYNTNGYRKIVEKLKDYLPTDDEGNKKILTPNVIFVKNGNIIGFNNDTAGIISNITPTEYWSDDVISIFKMEITGYILEYKEEM